MLEVGAMFSRRTSRELEQNALATALEAARAGGREVLDLTVSNPTTAQIPYDAAAITTALADPRAMVYAPEPLGLRSAREAAAAEASRAGVPIDPARVMLTASTSEAYAFLMKLLCDPGDDVLVPAPSYPLFDLLAAFESVRLVPYRLAYDGAWHVDLDSARRAVGPRTRAVFVVSPNNPTGSFLEKGELAGLASLGLPIVSDEVFADYAFDDAASSATTRARTALEDTSTLIFALGGLSKQAALPQMKLAWTCVGGPEARVAEALARLELLGDSFLSAGTPVQIALPALLASRARATDAIRARTRHNLGALRAAVGEGSAATLLTVEGGWYATLRVPRTQREEAWAIDLVEKDGVYTHPGHFFGFEDEAFLILSLLTPTDTFAEGIARLVRRVG
jgi:alanine-synthesizing transaminase